MKSKRIHRFKPKRFFKHSKCTHPCITNDFTKTLKEANYQEHSQEDANSSRKLVTFNANSLTDYVRESGEKYNLHRDDYIKAIFLCFMSQIKHNVVLVGEKGTGKEAIIFGIAEKIVNKQCPKEFWDYNLISVDANEFISQKYDSDSISAITDALEDYLTKNPKTILYIKNMCKIIDYNVLDLFATIFKNFLILGIEDSESFNSSIWDNDLVLSTSFEQLGLAPIKKEHVYDFLENHIKKLEKTYEIELPKDVFEYMVNIQYMEQIGEIDLLSIIEEAEWAMLNAKSDSQDVVSKETIIKIRKDKINTIKEYSPKKIRHLAYHEAGHAIAGLEIGKNISGVVITPDEYSLGFAMSTRDKYPCDTLSELKDYIVFIYGGTIGAKLFGFESQDGDQNDIENATKIAINIVSNFEMGQFVGNAEKLMNFLPESERSFIYEEINNILLNTREITEKILIKRKKDVEIIAEALLRKPILLRDEIDQLLNGTYNLEDLHDLNYWLE